ncbi:MAG: polysaccharide deacetylase family protein [Deltaproteobacteria bacterium]|nr:MAG: polysaccharide deacetylase family protein [Deltaproteobacteria bacterium]
MRRRRLIAAALLLLAACSRRPDVPILTYHSISDAPDGFTVSESEFTSHLDALQRAGFHTVTFHEWLAHEDRGTPLPAKPIVLTFDDGFEDAYSTVLPALRARGMRGTFFVVTSLVARDPAHRVARGEDGAQRRYLVWPEVRALAAAGMEIGSHGEHHLRMADLDRAQVLGELTRSKQTLDGVLGISTEVLAYPYNSVRRWIVPLARESGYRAAVAGMAHGNADRFTLYRMGVYRGTTADQVLAQLR